MEADEYRLMDQAESGMWWYRALHARLLAALAPVRGRVLDAGCGTGGLLALLRARRPDLMLIGCEWDGWAAARAAGKAGVAVARGGVGALPFAAGSFDAVVLADVLCHEAVDPPAALAEVARVLRPGGRLVVNMPAFMWLYSAHDRRVGNARRVSAGELRGWLEKAGFAVVGVRYWNGLLLPLLALRRKIRPDTAASDVAALPPWLDAILFAITRLEGALPPMPAGSSVLAIATRAEPPP